MRIEECIGDLESCCICLCTLKSVIQFNVALRHQLRQPVQRHVSSEYRYQVAILVIDRMRVGGHHLLTAASVIIWLAPVVLLQQFGNLIPVHIVVLIFRRAQLFSLDGAVDRAIGVRGEVLTLLGEIVGLKGNGRADDGRIKLQNLLNHRIKLVGGVQLFHNLRYHVVHSHFHSDEYTVDVLVGNLDTAFRILLGTA